MKTTTPLHPGLHLKSTKPKALNNTALAEKLNICRTTLWKFMRGKKRLDPDLAARLGEISGESARAWLERQHAFDVHQAESR